MKVSQLRQLIREEIEDILSTEPKLPTEYEVAKNLLIDLRKSFKAGKEIKVLGYPVTSWPMENFVVVNVSDIEGKDEFEKAKIPYTKKGIESYKFVVDDEPVEFPEFAPTEKQPYSNIPSYADRSSIGNDPYSKIGPRGGLGMDSRFR